jgi:hypothetical protein
VRMVGPMAAVIDAYKAHSERRPTGSSGQSLAPEIQGNASSPSDPFGGAFGEVELARTGFAPLESRTLVGAR